MKSRRSRRKTKAKGWKAFLPYLIFILGFAITAYPFISQAYYRIEANGTINDYIKSVKSLNQEEIDERLRLSHAYNSTLKPTHLADPFTDLQEKAYAEYARMLAVKEKLGYIEIPTIGEELPIYAGTSEEILQKGAGYLEGTSLPVGGESTHTVITAHTGLHKAKMFTDLVKVKKGEVFYLHVLDQTLAYEVDQILVVEPTDFEHLLVEEGQDYATLLTCTPYGINSHRLLVRGHRIPYEEAKKAQAKSKKLNWILIGAGIGVGLLILIGLLIFWRKKKAKKKATN